MSENELVGVLRVCVRLVGIQEELVGILGMCWPFIYIIKSITYIHPTHKAAKTRPVKFRDLAGGSHALDDLESDQSKTGTDGTCATATSNDINTAIDEIKQAGLWPWKGSGIE